MNASESFKGIRAPAFKIRKQTTVVVHDREEVTKMALTYLE